MYYGFTRMWKPNKHKKWNTLYGSKGEINMSNNKKNMFYINDGIFTPELFLNIFDIFNGEFNTPNDFKQKKVFDEMDRIRENILIEDRSCLNGVPANVYYTKDGFKIVEVAIPGKNKDNVKLTSNVIGGKTYLVFDISTASEDEKDTSEENKKTLTVSNIKGLNKLAFKVPVNPGLDVKKLEASVKHGLLTVSIPPSEENKPITFEIG